MNVERKEILKSIKDGKISFVFNNKESIIERREGHVETTIKTKITTLSLRTEEGILFTGLKKMKLRKKDILLLLDYIAKQPMRRFTNKEIGEFIDEKGLEIRPNSKSYYKVAYNLNKRVEKELGVEDLIIATKESLQINSDIMGSNDELSNIIEGDQF